MANVVTPFTVKTERGESRSGHGISFTYNAKNVTKAQRAKREARRIQRRSVRGNWSNESRGKATEIPLVYPSDKAA